MIHLLKTHHIPENIDFGTIKFQEVFSSTKNQVTEGMNEGMSSKIDYSEINFSNIIITEKGIEELLGHQVYNLDTKEKRNNYIVRMLHDSHYIAIYTRNLFSILEKYFKENNIRFNNIDEFSLKMDKNVIDTYLTLIMKSF